LTINNTWEHNAQPRTWGDSRGESVLLNPAEESAENESAMLNWQPTW
jgi:hypothetical protein